MNVNATDVRSTRPSQATVYVVVKDAGLSRSIGRLLRAAGHEVATFTSAAEFLAQDFSPASCLILGAGLRGLSGPGWYDRLVVSKTVPPVVFLGSRADFRSAVQPSTSGPLDFLAPPFTDSELLAAIATALGRGRSRQGQRVLCQDARDRLARLTPRELQVCELIAAGHLDKEIAAEMGRAEATIQRYHRQITRKLALRSVDQLSQLLSVARQP